MESSKAPTPPAPEKRYLTLQLTPVQAAFVVSTVTLGISELVSTPTDTTLPKPLTELLTKKRDLALRVMIGSPDNQAQGLVHKLTEMDKHIGPLLMKDFMDSIFAGTFK